MRFVAAGLLLFCIAVSINARAATPNWQKIVTDRLPQFGHRNWIVIADSAYPAQSKDGIETIVVDADQMTVVRGVLNILSHAKHVTPIIYLDQELQYLDEKDAPGIDAYRTQINALLMGKQAQQLPHEQIISKLDQVSQTFRVLIIKTNMTLPYTSVFLQLDCAYWGPDAEKRLRERMASAPAK
jgi:L-fucose mutarotase/ribose pyranase (RbsD/FucU family)